MPDASAFLNRLDAIPAELKALPRHVPWQYRATRSGGKLAKVPLGLNASGQLVAVDAHDPANHFAFERAVEIARQHPGTGLGFDIVEGDGLEGLDFDECIDAAGEIHTEVLELLHIADTYAERSPSGRGIRAFGYGPPLASSDRKQGRTKSGIAFERYTGRRFLTVTGDAVSARPLADLSALRELLNATYLKRQEPTPRPTPLSDDLDFDIAVAKASLSLLSAERADSYLGWFKAGSACADIGDAMHDAWLAFSRRSPKFDASECEAKWQHLCERGERREIGTAVGTLLAMAQEDGGASCRDILAMAEASIGRPRKGSELISIVGIGSKPTVKADPDIDSLPVPEADALAYRPFPIHALPPVLRDYVAELGQALCADHGAIATVALGALAAAIATTRQAEAKRSWRTYPMLWCGLVADSGDLKSPIMRAVLWPTKAIQDELMREYGEAKRLYEQQLAEHEQQLAEWKKGKQTGERPQPPEKPIARRIWTADVTVEAAASTLATDPAARGIVIISDELVGWLGSFDRYKGGRGDEGFFLSGHGGDSFIADRKTGDRPVIHARRVAISIIGGIQPGRAVAEFNAARRASGLVPRFIIAMPPRRPVEWTEAEPSPLTADSYAGLVRRLYELTHDLDGNGETVPSTIRLSPEAKAAFKAWFRDHKQHQRRLMDDVRAAMSKILELPLRLGIVLHEVAIATKRHDLPPDEMSLSTMASAITIAEWFRHEVRRLYRLLASSPAELEAAATRDAIAASILEELWQRGRMSRREIRDAIGSAGVSTDIMHALADLQARGDVVREADGEAEAWLPAKAAADRKSESTGTGGFTL
jgi:hypothetical protein